MRAGLGDVKEKLPDGTEVSYNSLNANQATLSTKEGKKALKEACSQLWDYLGMGSKDLFSRMPDGTAIVTQGSMFTKVFCSVQGTIGGMGAGYQVDKEGQKVAEGLNLLETKVKHSCYPNTQGENVGRKTVLRCVRNIEKFRDTTRAYTNVLFGQPRSVRRLFLLKTCNLNCRCNECEMKTPGAREREALRDRPFRCQSCKMNGKKKGQCVDCEALGAGDDLTMLVLHGTEKAELLTRYAHSLKHYVFRLMFFPT